METLFSRHRNTAVLVSVLIVQLMLLAWQIKRPDSEVPLIRTWVQTLMTPPQKMVSGSLAGIRDVWENYADLRSARKDNLRLEEELVRQRLLVHELHEQAAELERLRALVDFRDKSANTLVAARIIGSGASDLNRVVFINKGSEAGLKPNFGVITQDGVVGKVQRVFPNSAQILLITDSDSGVGAMMEGSRIHGILKGQNSAACILQYVLNDEKVEAGEKIFTSGDDRVYPKGLPVGTVTSVRAGSPFKQITVQPLARLNRLEEVLVVIQGVDVEPPAPASKAEIPQPQPQPQAVTVVPAQRTADGDVVVSGSSPEPIGPQPPQSTAAAAAKPRATTAATPSESDRPGIPRGARPETEADKIREQYKQKAEKEAKPTIPATPATPAPKKEPPKQ